MEEMAQQQAEAQARQQFGNEKDDELDLQPPKLQVTSGMLGIFEKDRMLLDPETTSKEEQNAWFSEFKQGW